MQMSQQDVMGEGTSSICRRGISIDSGDAVAIKVYKEHRDATVMKFRRQISVLDELQKPFQHLEGALWNEQLTRVSPCNLFMRLIDYSRDADGTPGPDPSDNELYVVTELGQQSLKDFIKQRRASRKPLSNACVKSITKAMVLVTAGLHAKGFVHLDLKPENLMMFDGRLKLIDVDGCVRAGSVVSIRDTTLSFSPVYCAPEWARFLIDDSDDPHITVSPALDVWSVGMTACELVSLDAVLKPKYMSFGKMARGKRDRRPNVYFYNWLSKVEQSPLTDKIQKFDEDFVDLVSSCFLVGDPENRKALAQSLDHPYLAQPSLCARSCSSPLTNSD